VPRLLSLAALTLRGTPPPEFIQIASEVGCSGVSLSAGINARSRTQRYSIVNDPVVRRETERALAKTGMRLDLVEGVSVETDIDFSQVREGLRVMRDLGARLLNLTFWDPDPVRSANTLQRYCSVAAEIGFCVSVEFTPISALASLADALALIESARFVGLKLLADSLHLARCGATAADLAIVDRSTIAFSQISDGPLHSAGLDAYREEALYERQIPGEGQLPLLEFVAALPADIVVAVEVPMRSLAEQGITAFERARRAVTGAKKIIDAAART
jgi:sugar phosphate isomerase/epimerase